MTAMFTTAMAQEVVDFSTGTFGGAYGDKDTRSQWTSANGVKIVSTDGYSDTEIGTMKFYNGEFLLYITTEVSNKEYVGTRYTITAPEGYVISEMKFKNGNRAYETSIDYGLTSDNLPKDNKTEVTITLPTDENWFFLRGKVANRDFIKIASLTITKIGGEETSINEITTDTEKVIYDLTGRRIDEITEAGIYIVNGKKTLIK
jgi:hypothetical protein